MTVRSTITVLALTVGGVPEGCMAARPTTTPNYEQLAAEYEARFEVIDDEAWLDLIREYVSRFRALAEAQPSSPDAGESLAWIATHAVESQDIESALPRLIDDYVDEPYMLDVCAKLSDQFHSFAAAGLDAVVARARNPSISTGARFFRARHELRVAKAVRDLRDDRTRAPTESQWTQVPEEMVRWLDSLDPSALQFDGEHSLESLAASADDIRYQGRTIADLARSTLYEIRDLAVGRPAPEITGEDVDGAPLSLSQFRGRVVVLDFWGNW